MLVAVLAFGVVPVAQANDGGTVAGGLIGGLIGSRFGGGDGNKAMIVVGAVSGALLGDKMTGGNVRPAVYREPQPQYDRGGYSTTDDYEIEEAQAHGRADRVRKERRLQREEKRRAARKAYQCAYDGTC